MRARGLVDFLGAGDHVLGIEWVHAEPVVEHHAGVGGRDVGVGTTTVGGAVTVGAGTGGIVANGDGGTGTLTLGSSLTFDGAGSLALSPIGGATLTTAPDRKSTRLNSSH